MALCGLHRLGRATDARMVAASLRTVHRAGGEPRAFSQPRMDATRAPSAGWCCKKLCARRPDLEALRQGLHANVRDLQ